MTRPSVRQFPALFRGEVVFEHGDHLQRFMNCCIRHDSRVDASQQVPYPVPDVMDLIGVPVHICELLSKSVRSVTISSAPGSSATPMSARGIAEVGDAHHRGEKYVMALFGPCEERGDYYIVTIRRGFLDPSGAMFVHASEVHSLDYFL